MTEKLTQWEKGYMEGRKGVKAAGAECDRLAGRVAELEKGLAEEEGSRKGISARCNEVESRLQQATEDMASALTSLETGPLTDGYAASILRSRLAALAGEDDG